MERRGLTSSFRVVLLSQEHIEPRDDLLESLPHGVYLPARHLRVILAHRFRKQLNPIIAGNDLHGVLEQLRPFPS
jgi:hypothetical protein